MPSSESLLLIGSLCLCTVVAVDPDELSAQNHFPPVLCAALATSSLLAPLLCLPRWKFSLFLRRMNRAMLFRISMTIMICLSFVSFYWMFTCKSGRSHVGPAILRMEISEPRCSRCALVMTPYDLTPGGGENYLLRSVSLLQGHGYVVDLLVLPHNTCQNSKCALRTAAFLRVDIDSSKLNFLVGNPREHEVPVRIAYDVFFLLGNEKTPTYRNPAKFGIYMCQFPFDLDKTTSLDEASRLSSFHAVWLNSQYTLKWYTKFIQPALNIIRQLEMPSNTLLWPSVNVVYPPVEPLLHPSEVLPDSARSGILMIGRFFQGRQSKGHEFAIRILRNMVSSAHALEGVKLTMAGSLMHGHETWLQQLKAQARDLPVLFLVDCPPDELRRVANEASILWHLTGIDSKEEEDPASIEHFGMSVVESMSVGVIPVVMDVGGTSEIVDKTCGRLGNSVTDFILSTLEILRMPSDERQAMRDAAMQRATRFSFTRFLQQGKQLLDRGVLELSFRRTLDKIPVNDEAVKALERRPVDWIRPSYAAVIVEHRPHFALERVCKNMFTNLAPLWTMYIYHSTANEEFVRKLFGAYPHVQLRLVKQEETSVTAYNRLLTSEQFWAPLARYKRVLIFQVDSFLLRPLADQFLRYDYVGAPWCMENELARDLVESHQITEYVGNGGFSLRNPQEMLKCAALAQQYRYNAADENEDVFFVKCLAKRHKAIAPAHIAAQFSVEVPCNGSANIGMVNGVHAAWYYMSFQTYSNFLAEQAMLVTSPR